MPVPGVPVGPGDKVKQDADKKIASGLQGAVDDAADWLDKATACSFGRACSSDDTKQTDGPNAGKNLTDAEKVELGGAGSGTPGGWGPEDEENARNSGNSKPSQNGSNFTESEINDRLTAANKPINNQGMSAAARAWEKHAGRPGGTFEPLTGNPAQKNAAAEGFIRDVLNNPNTVRNELSRGGVDYRLPNGQGIRFNADGSFNTLLDPPVKK